MVIKSNRTNAGQVARVMKFTVRITRQVVAMPPTVTDDAAAMLQLPHKPLTLHDKLFLDRQVPINLIHVDHVGVIPDRLPSHVLVSDEHCEHDVQRALQEFDQNCHAYCLPATGICTCFACYVVCSSSGMALHLLPIEISRPFRDCHAQG